MHAGCGGGTCSVCGDMFTCMQGVVVVHVVCVVTCSYAGCGGGVRYNKHRQFCQPHKMDGGHYSSKQTVKSRSAYV